MPKPSSNPTALSASCHCGAVRIEVDRQPETITQCNCSICRRYGALWAYYQYTSIRLVAAPDALETYVWDTKRVQFRRCRSCGCVTHWDRPETVTDGRCGVNVRLMDQQAAIAKTPIKVLDGDGSWETLRTFTQPDLLISPGRLDPNPPP